ncbi:MAG TPA: hypothetical protein VHB77_08945 [Planctomycetaceae bacterium]|nr:hypothetical protein [Planctomycetaceae bacterium]
MLRIHRFAVALLCAVVACGLVCGSRISAAPEKPRPAAGGAAGQSAVTAAGHIRLALRSPTEVDFVDTPLRDGLEYLANLHNIRILPDKPKLQAEGVAMDTPVSISLKGVTLESALDLLLSPLQLDFFVEGGVLRVTTAAKARETFQMEVYPVRDLVLDGEISPDELLDILKASVAPQSWDSGQTSLRIARDNLLIVRQTPRTQRALGHVLDQFREKLRAAALPDEPQQGVERIRQAMREPTEFNFVDTSLRDCLAYLADLHKIAIWANEQALTDEGVAIDTPVTLALTDVTLESALELLLDRLQLDFYIKDEVLQITTQAEAKNVFQVEMHPVRDLLDSGFKADELNEVLTSAVAPESWDNGRASLRIVGGNLLVARQTPGIQRELVQALEKLRAGIRAQ